MRLGLTTAASCKRNVVVGAPIRATSIETFATDGKKCGNGLGALYLRVKRAEMSLLADKQRLAEELPSLEATYAELAQKLDAIEAALDRLLDRRSILKARLSSPNPGSERMQQRRREEIRRIDVAYQQKESSLEALKLVLKDKKTRIDKARAAKKELGWQPVLTPDNRSGD
jgi:exonuclease VII large subunit